MRFAGVIITPLKRATAANAKLPLSSSSFAGGSIRVSRSGAWHITAFSKHNSKLRRVANDSCVTKQSLIRAGGTPPPPFRGYSLSLPPSLFLLAFHPAFSLGSRSFSLSYTLSPSLPRLPTSACLPGKAITARSLSCSVGVYTCMYVYVPSPFPWTATTSRRSPCAAKTA